MLLDRAAARIGDEGTADWFAVALLSASTRVDARLEATRTGPHPDSVDWAIRRAASRLRSPGTSPEDVIDLAYALISVLQSQRGTLTGSHFRELVAAVLHRFPAGCPQSGLAVKLLEFSAGNPACPPDVLRDLALHPLKRVRYAATSNAACPTDASVAAALLDLADRHPC